MAAISRLVRRVCLLREQGELAEAREFESTQLADAVRTYREDSGAEGLTESQLHEMFSVEGGRAADASALCELLIPRLTAMLPAQAPHEQRPRRVAAPPPLKREASPEGGSPDIPELLDAMLAAERTGRRVTQGTRSRT
ncbi:MAG TPA: hypothetical protein VMM36_01300 [Opitutaceae bacterium]|nr:hypothetical protein [Opitutaceae bacterium]